MGKKADDAVRDGLLDLQRNTDFFMAVFNGLSGCAVIAADFDGNVLAFNKGAERIYGCKSGDVVGRKTVEEFFPRDFTEGGGLQRLIKDLMETGGAKYEGENVRRGGERFPGKSLFTLTRSTDGRMFGFVIITDDLTVLMRAQGELLALNAELDRKVVERTAWLEEERERHEASEKRLRTLLESANDAVIGIEPPGVVYLWNSKAESMFGYAALDAIGKDITGLIVPEKYREAMQEALPLFFEAGSGKLIGKNIGIEGLRSDGELFPIELSISAIKIRGAWNALGILRDVTERKSAEEELRRNLDEAERINRVMVGRELKIVELKERIQELEAKMRMP